MIRILVADDQAMLRQAFAVLLDLESDLEVVGQAATTTEAVAEAVRLEPDVVVMDVQMPAGGDAGGQDPDDGIAATAEIRRLQPNVRVLIVTTFGRPGYLRRALDAGASGFMVKDAPSEHLVDGIRRVAQGLRVIDPELAVASLTAGTSTLTDRETEVLRAAGQGGSTADIARRVHLSEGTVRNHLSAAIGKTGAASRADAVRIATDNGWLG